MDEAELGQGLDPARGIPLNVERFIVGSGIAVMFAPLEHEDEGAQNLKTEGGGCRH